LQRPIAEAANRIAPAYPKNTRKIGSNRPDEDHTLKASGLPPYGRQPAMDQTYTDTCGNPVGGDSKQHGGLLNAQTVRQAYLNEATSASTSF
jgi:hypothetical protein